MVIVIKSGTPKEAIDDFAAKIGEKYSVQIDKSIGKSNAIIGLVGDTHSVDIESIAAQPIVETVRRIQEPYKKANRKFHPDNTVIKINDSVSVGDGSLNIIAGPCSVESEEQIV